MSGSYSFTRLAATDLEGIQEYIALDRPVASLKWVDALEERCQKLADNPHWGRKRNDLRPNLRSLPFGRYILFYRETAGGIEIVRVLHSARDLEKQLGLAKEK